MVVVEILIALVVLLVFAFFLTQVIYPMVTGTPILPLLRGGWSPNKDLEKAEAEVNAAKDELKAIDMQMMAQTYKKQIKKKKEAIKSQDTTDNNP